MLTKNEQISCLTDLKVKLKREASLRFNKNKAISL